MARLPLERFTATRCSEPNPKTACNRRSLFQTFCIASILLLVSQLGLAQSLTGQSPFSTVVGGGFETINVGNLNVHLAIPVVHKKGRGLDFDYVLNYDSTVMTPGVVNGQRQWVPAPNWGWRGISEASVGYLTYSGWYYGGPCLTNLYYLGAYYDRLGTMHPVDSADGGPGFLSNPADPLNGCPGTDNFETTDGSGYTFTASVDDRGKVTISNFIDRSGNTIVAPLFNVINGPPANTNGPGSITDPIGNQLSTDGTNFFDTFGLKVLSVSGTNPVKYTYTGPSQSSPYVSVNYSPYWVATNFRCSGITEYPRTQVQLVSSIGLPDGTSYTFNYEANGSNYTGRLASVGLPTGGTISYTYTGNNSGMTKRGQTWGQTGRTPFFPEP